jgi:hypothetical protein
VAVDAVVRRSSSRVVVVAVRDREVADVAGALATSTVTLVGA